MKLTFTSNTPDISERRFDKSHMVFLWDDLTDVSAIGRVLGATPLVYRYAAVTQERFLPVYNIAADIDNWGYGAFMAPDPDEMGYLDDDMLDMADHLPVIGKVYRMSLDELIRLDVHYQNKAEFQRQQVRLLSHPTSGEELYAWTYLSPMSVLAEYDPEELHYTPWEGVEITPFSIDSKYGAYSF